MATVMVCDDCKERIAPGEPHRILRLICKDILNVNADLCQTCYDSIAAYLRKREFAYKEEKSR